MTKNTINNLINIAKSQKQFEQLARKDGLDSEEILMYLIEKYYIQRMGSAQSSGGFAESEENLADNILWDQWFNDGQPTGIEDDRMFENLQKKVYNEVIYR